MTSNPNGTIIKTYLKLTKFLSVDVDVKHQNLKWKPSNYLNLARSRPSETGLYTGEFDPEITW